MLDFGWVSSNGSEPNIAEFADASALAFDIESSGTNTSKDVAYGFSLAANENSALYTTMGNRFFTDLLANEEILKIGHNIKFDRSLLKKSGVTINNLCCTMIAAHLLEENRLSLEELQKRWVRGYDLEFRTYSQYEKPIPHSTVQEMANHFGVHSIATLILWNTLQRELRANGLWNVFWNVEMPLVPVLSDIELDGTYIDKPYLEGLGKVYDTRINTLHEALCDMTGEKNANFNSADQAARILYRDNGVPLPPGNPHLHEDYKNLKNPIGPIPAEAGKEPHKGPPTRYEESKGLKEYWTDKGRPSVTKKYVEQFKKDIPLVSVYIMYKHYRHLKDTYVTGIIERLVDGRIHTNFNQTRTITGRLSSTDPNLQNIPQRDSEGKKIRKAFAAPPGFKIIKGDMEQCELKKMACLANCIPMLNAFRNGEDIHAATALRAYGTIDERPKGKTLNFKLVYGGGDAEAQRILFDAYPEIKVFMGNMLNTFHIFGYARSDNGRKRTLGDFSRMNKQQEARALREGLSLMDQGSCAEYLKVSMAKFHKHIEGSDVKMLLQVHDELVLECPDRDVKEVAHLLQEDMRYDGLQIPLTAAVSIGNTWGDTVDQEDFVLEEDESDNEG